MFGPTATRMRLKSVIFGPVKETELSDHENSALVLTKYFLRPYILIIFLIVFCMQHFSVFWKCLPQKKVPSTYCQIYDKGKQGYAPDSKL